MIRIDCFTRDGCDACKIAIKNITDAINEANCDITLNIHNTNLDDILRKEITKFPTTVITKVDNDYNRKELARLEGSFPNDYIKDIINKLQQFNGDRVVLVEDTEYGEFQAIDVKPEDDRFVMITTTVK
jgi:hypothetical protein